MRVRFRSNGDGTGRDKGNLRVEGSGTTRVNRRNAEQKEQDHADGAEFDSCHG